MKFPWINDPGSSNLMTTITVVTVLAAVARFLLDGVILTLGTHVFNFGHVDSLTYTAILAPVLGAHGWIQSSLSGGDGK